MMRIGIVGYGKMGRLHRQVFEAQGCEVVGSVNRSEKGRAMAKEEGIPQTFSELDDLLDATEPDAVLCCVSFPEVAEVVGNLASCGLPVLIEKPPGLDSDEFEFLRFHLQKGYRLPHLVGLNRRHYSVHRKAVEALGGREALTGITVQWSENPQAFLDRGYSDFDVHSLAVANSLHGLDILSWWGGACGDPQVEGKLLNKPFGREMRLNVTGEWGADIRFESSWVDPVRWRLTFEAGDASVVCAPLEEAVLKRPGEEPVIIAPDAVDVEFKAGLYAQASAFIEVVREDKASHAHDMDHCAQSMSWACQLTNIF